MTDDHKTPCPDCGRPYCHEALEWFGCPWCAAPTDRHRAGTPKRESDVEDYLLKRAKAIGAEVRKVKWLCRDKAPDRALFMPSGTTFWVEVKSPSKGPLFPSNAHERGQAREHEKLRRVGQVVVAVHNYHMVDQLLAPFA